MKMNLMVTSVLFTFSFTLFSAERNLCDDFVDEKLADEVIQKCIAKYGASETYTLALEKKKWEDNQRKIKDSEEDARKANIESRKFTMEEIEEVGLPVFAERLDYSNYKRGEKSTLTLGDTLCKSLGFEKSLKSVLSGEILPLEAYKKGVVLNAKFFNKKPELYKDEGVEYSVRKFTEITCAKVISKEVPGASDALSEVVEDITRLPGQLASKPLKSDSTESDDVDNSARKADQIKNVPARTPSPYEYVRKPALTTPK